MSAIPLRKKWYSPLAALAAASFLTSCFSLGVHSLPENPPAWEYQAVTPLSPQEPQTTEIKSAPVRIKVHYMGEAKPVATGYSAIGLITRYVVPYTHQTLLFQISLENQGQQPVQLQPIHIQLETTADATPLKPLPLAYFKQAWPTQAVRTPEMLVDQSIAVGEVIRTLFTGQTVLPGRTVSGTLAFLKPEIEPQTLKLVMTHIETAIEPQTATVIFEKK